MSVQKFVLLDVEKKMFDTYDIREKDGEIYDYFE